MLAAVHTMLGTELSVLLGCLALFLAGTVAGHAMANGGATAPVKRSQKEAKSNPPVGAKGTVTKYNYVHPQHVVERKFPADLRASNKGRVPCTLVGAGDQTLNNQQCAV